MKKLKTLIPAFCAMLVSAVMLGTSTYAWFSVNKKVTATDMQVTAQSNTQYFIVSANGSFDTNAVEATAALTQGGIGSVVDGVQTTVVAPAAYDLTSGGKGVDDKWWTANVNEYNATTDDKIINVTEITVPETKTEVYENNNYFVGYTFYVGLAANSEDYTGALKIKATNDSAKGAAVAAVKIEQMEKSSSDWVAPSTAIVDTTNVAGSSLEFTSTVNTFTLSAGAKCVKVTVYVYIDGNNSFVIDNNIGSITGSVSIQVGASDITLA